MIITRYSLFIVLACLTINVAAQQKDWQWIKRGGASIEGNKREAVYDIATDSDRNVYVLSPIGVHNLDIDGHPKTYYGGSGGTSSDYALASFACDGSYRWSKIIGGRGLERGIYIETDDDNLYVAGMFGSCNSQTQGGPPRIENDIILPGQTNTDCSLLFISKFDKSGNMMWFKRPMPQTTDVVDAYDGYSYNIAIDANSNIYWLVALPPGSYANGAFINTMQGINWFVLKYGSSGNFIDATYLNIQLSPVANTSLKMYRNPNNGYFYVTANRASNETATVNGQAVTGTFYMACFDEQGNFQWIRQNTYNSIPGGPFIYSLEFDNQNNIYMGGKFIGGGDHVFLGQSVQLQGHPHFVMKANPTASSVFWFSNSNFGGAFNFGGFALQENKVSYTNQGAGQNFTWGNQTININNSGEGTEVLLALFDKNTGACIQLDFIQGNTGNGYADRGTALAMDANGDVLVGGEFFHTLYDANGGSVMNPNPSNPDFFISKYATEPCPPLSVEEVQKEKIGVWPNPVKDELYTDVEEETIFKLYALDGRMVKVGKLSKNQNNIDVAGFSEGVYLLELKAKSGETKTVKVVKE